MIAWLQEKRKSLPFFTEGQAFYYCDYLFVT